MSLILGLETSCDETAAAVVRDGRWVLSNVIATQNDLHARYGGVVPEIASRAHIERISPVIDEALQQAGLGWQDLGAIAVGNRPGLIGSLLVGLSTAKAIAWALGKPLIGVDHVRAHLYAAHLAPQPPRAPGVSPAVPPADQPSIPLPDAPAYPALGLVVSGGHTSLYALDHPLHARLLGKTIDDAVGEAYDKVAVILQLPYPGGPNLDKLARTGNPKAYDLPRSLLSEDSLDFSYSGLKTAMLYLVRGKPVGRGKEAHFERSASDLTDQQRRDLAASFQAAAVRTILQKLDRAIDQLAAQGQRVQSVIVGGGVSANSHLREMSQAWAQKRGVRAFLPGMAYCMDNAAMIAGLAHVQLQAGDIATLDLPAIATTAM